MLTEKGKLRREVLEERIVGSLTREETETVKGGSIDKRRSTLLLALWNVEDTGEIPLGDPHMESFLKREGLVV